MRFTWVNISNTSSSISGGMPSPVSVTRTIDFPAFSYGRELDGAPFGRVLGGVGEEVTDHLGKTGRVGVEPDRFLRQGELQGVPCSLDDRAGWPRRPFRPLPQQARAPSAG